MTKLLKICIVIAVIAPVGIWDFAKAAESPNTLRLDGLFADELVGMTANLCGQRVPSSKTVWDSTLKEWRKSHAQKLSEIQSIRRAVEKSLNGPRNSVVLDWQHYEAYRSRNVAYVMYGLATADDEHAPKMCDLLRQKYSDQSKSDEFLDQASEDGLALLKSLTTP